jgi:hypothetical protein
MFGLNLELLLAVFTHPVMLAINECVVVNAFAVVIRAQIAFHHD